jgi:hypothetical protein
MYLVALAKKNLKIEALRRLSCSDGTGFIKQWWKEEKEREERK